MPVQSSVKEVSGSTFLATWPAMAAGDDGSPISYPGAPDRSVQVSGTFGGASVVLEGSIDGATYSTLSDPQGNALSFTGDRIEAICELVLFVRPRVVGGDGSTSINVNLLMRSAM